MARTAESVSLLCSAGDMLPCTQTRRIRLSERRGRQRFIYVWGATREKNITEAWIRKHETTVKNADRTIAFWKRQISLGFGDTMRAFDCLYSPHCGDMDVETAFPQDILDTG